MIDPGSCSDRFSSALRTTVLAAVCLLACEEPAREAPLAVRRVTLGPGDFLHATVEQQGLDVLAALAGPGGEELLAIDSPNGDRSPEDLFFVAEEGGTYVLEVRSLGDAGGGRFALRVDSRPATAMDRVRAEACAAVSRGDAALEGSAADRREAPRWYEKAIGGWRRSEEAYQEALTETRLGKAFSRLGKVALAARQWERALSLVKNSKIESLEPMLHNSLGVACERLGELERARSFHEAALAGARRQGNRHEETAAINNIGILEKHVGEPWRALLFFEEALAGWREMGDETGAAATLHNLGTLYTVLGKLPEARQSLSEALALYRSLGRRDKEAATLLALGWVRHLEGDAPGARADLLLSLKLRKEEKERRGEAVTLDRLGTVYRDSGELDQAVFEYRKALALLDGPDDQQGRAMTLSNLGEALTLRGDPAAGLRHQALALKVLEGRGQPSAEAYARSRSARAHRALGNLEAAWADVRTALQKLEKIRERTESDDLRMAYLDSVHEIYQFSVDLLMDLHGRRPGKGYDRLALELSEWARARGLLDLLGEARDRRLEANSGELHRLEEELREAERRHAVSHLAAEEARIRRLLREREKILVDLRARGAKNLSARPLETAEIQRLLDPGTVLLAYFLGDERSFVWAVSDRGVASAVLPPGKTIETAAMRLHSLIARSHLKGTAEQLRLTAEELSAMLLGPVAHRLGGERIIVLADGALAYVPFGALPHPAAGGELLIARQEVTRAPSASVLAAIRERAAERPPVPGLVAVVADPIFSRDDPRLAPPGRVPEKPFALAGKGPPSGGAVTRSARDLGLLRLARLPFSRQEASAILALAGPERSFGVMDSDASLALVTGGRLKDFRIVHFATHALIHPKYPELSGVVLSLVDGQGRPQPGFLRSYQIFSLHLPADLVVLSACRTGLGLELDGEGVVGLTQSFFHAGASRVVVSLWDVDDQAAARLMERFYRELLVSGRPPAAALRAAQLSLREDPLWSAPYYWAGFVLQGDPRPAEHPLPLRVLPSGGSRRTGPILTRRMR